MKSLYYKFYSHILNVFCNPEEKYKLMVPSNDPKKENEPKNI